MDHEFEIAGPERQKNLLYHQNDLLKPNEYFHKIRPTDAAEVDNRRAEAEAKKKAAAEAAVKAAAAKAAEVCSDEKGNVGGGFRSDGHDGFGYGRGTRRLMVILVETNRSKSVRFVMERLAGGISARWRRSLARSARSHVIRCRAHWSFFFGRTGAWF